jgi:hypothetical protein
MLTFYCELHSNQDTQSALRHFAKKGSHHRIQRVSIGLLALRLDFANAATFLIFFYFVYNESVLEKKNLCY